MKVTDYIVEFLISKGITDVFGYPGGVVCHLIDSITKYDGQIAVHTNYHEQGAAFAACGYAQERCGVGVAYATSGPGATNLVTGIANAYFDSIPVIFLTGQVDTYGLKGKLPIRQRGFQETDVISIVESITKWAIRVDTPDDIMYCLERAYEEAVSGNPGPVVIDLPADVQRANIDTKKLRHFKNGVKCSTDIGEAALRVLDALSNASHPCLLVGNGVKQSGNRNRLREFAEMANIPTVFSMPAFDTLPYGHELNFGFIGANGHRYANFVLGKSDLIIVIGSRLDLKQVGSDRAKFAPKAKLVRIDIDSDNFSYPVHGDEVAIWADASELLPELIKRTDQKKGRQWVKVCSDLKERLSGYDRTTYTDFMQAFGKLIPKNVTITADVGQSEVWVAQYVQIKEGQSVHLSAGHGAMGYSLPAAIGAYYGNRRPVISFNGDGGIQMNIQELQYVAREKIPIKIVVVNNRSLGMIRGFQEANFEKNYAQTIEGRGYSMPDFLKIAAAYGIPYCLVKNIDDLNRAEVVNILTSDSAGFIELEISEETVLNPNFGGNGRIEDQRPYMDRELFEELMKL
jgi:acetolactate synthase-1/2/3 large subunit